MTQHAKAEMEACIIKINGGLRLAFRSIDESSKSYKDMNALVAQEGLRPES
jgi:hypothetical protein